ncbi:four-helix bundle copper-binding protein [Nocardia panacis]|uniref:Four-helix bundle copper-binding protein n=1 Tax=Nocardia panacis TaxID=2340916 RepID=A0A3A4KC39_9NOCA|nr:four-helix bundle copper-binding protein [Nocardia panacis]
MNKDCARTDKAFARACRMLVRRIRR